MCLLTHGICVVSCTVYTGQSSDMEPRRVTTGFVGMRGMLLHYSEISYKGTGTAGAKTVAQTHKSR